MSTPSPHKVLVVANEAADAPSLRELLRRHTATSGADVLIVTPALDTRVRHWQSDSDGAVEGARRRLDRCLDMLASVGIAASGLVGDADPLTAIEDALAWFGADELVIVTHPPERANRLAHDLAERAAVRFGLPTGDLVIGPVPAPAPVPRRPRLVPGLAPGTSAARLSGVA